VHTTTYTTLKTLFIYYLAVYISFVCCKHSFCEAILLKQHQFVLCSAYVGDIFQHVAITDYCSYTATIQLAAMQNQLALVHLLSVTITRC
jgi:hypothetical protein